MITHSTIKLSKQATSQVIQQQIFHSTNLSINNFHNQLVYQPVNRRVSYCPQIIEIINHLTLHMFNQWNNQSIHQTICHSVIRSATQIWNQPIHPPFKPNNHPLNKSAADHIPTGQFSPLTFFRLTQFPWAHFPVDTFTLDTLHPGHIPLCTFSPREGKDVANSRLCYVRLGSLASYYSVKLSKYCRWSVVFPHTYKCIHKCNKNLVQKNETEICKREKYSLGQIVLGGVVPEGHWPGEEFSDGIV